MTSEDRAAERRCGFVAVLGAPNAGKSTLVNAFVGAKVTIVTPKVQTTRTRVLGICADGATQLIFVDTPGIFDPKRRLERAMVAAAWRGAADADTIVVMIDAARAAARGIDDDTGRIFKGLEKTGRKAILALNKIDLMQRQKLLALADEVRGRGLFTDMFMVSALTGDGVKHMRAHLAESAQVGPWLFPEDQLSDMPERLLAAEITREQLFLKLHDELPYALTVETESWENFRNGSAKINQVIYIRRPSQKAIVLGKGGKQIKSVGAAARGELEKILGRRVHLMLHVKVREKWVDDPARYREWGLDFEA
jgi:GTP-binding protein Era